VTNLATALLEAQKAMPAIHKDSKAEVIGKTKDGKPYKYSYGFLSLPALLETALPVLNKAGLAFTQMPSVRDDGQQVLVTTLLYAGTDETLIGETPLILTGVQTPQTWGGAVTYARRYALTSLLGIAADEDDDGAAASRPKVPKKQAAKTDDDFDFPAGSVPEKPSLELLAEIRKLASDLIEDKSSDSKKLQQDLGKLEWRTDPTEAQMAVAKLRLYFGGVAA
jgi:hypothetical protein